MKTTRRAHCTESFWSDEVQGQDPDSSVWPQGCDRKLQEPAVQPDVRIGRIPEDIIDVDVPRVMEETVEVVKHIPMTEECMEGVKLIPHDEVQKRTVQRIVGVPVLHGFGKKLGKSSSIVRKSEFWIVSLSKLLREHTVEATKVITMVCKRTKRSRCPFHKARRR